MKNFVLDTNVLIHNPKAIYSFADNNVVIPIIVIEELDRFKSFSDKKGMHAREVLRDIDKLIKTGSLQKGADLPNGGKLIVAFGSKDVSLPDVDKSFADNKILSIAWEMQQKGERVFFVSKDLNLRIKAEAFGIKTRDYEKQKVEYTSLYKGWKEVLTNKQDIDNLYETNKLEIDESKYSFFANEFALVKAEDCEGSTAICRYNSIEKCLVPLKGEYRALGISPLNMEQKFAFDLLLNDKVKLVSLIGKAGTGKTLIALACALSKILGADSVYERLLVARPIMPFGRDIGFLPGTKEKKLNYWMQPIFDNLEFILKRSVSSRKLKIPTSQLTTNSLINSDLIEIEALTYIRGRSIPNQFLIVDEAQNLTPHEIKTIVSRVGEGTKIVLTGDAEQIDNPYLDANSNGLSYSVEHMKEFGLCGHMFLSKSERSELATLAVENL